jgi:hypothetical protein
MSRTLWPLAALAILALIVAGCGNGSAGTGNGTAISGGTSTASIHEKAVKFAKCMRTNGVSAFPDPNASGELTIDGIANGSSVDTSSAINSVKRSWGSRSSPTNELSTPRGRARAPAAPEPARARRAG